MQITPEQYENIQNYLNGVMTPDEERAFLNELSQNTTLKESIDFEKELRDNLNSIQGKKELFEKPEDYYEVDKNASDYNSIKSLIETAGDEWEQESKRLSGTNELIVDNKRRLQKAKIVNIKSWIGIAAAACVILAIASLKLFWPKSYVSPPIAKTTDTSSVKKSTNNNVTKITPNDSIKNSNPEIKKISPAAAFKKYYAKDMSSSPLPELLATVPNDYQRGDYAYNEKIDLEHVPNTRGSSNDINSKQNILQFGHYYKGLSFIETNNNIIPSNQ